jgi:hypothetical protein
VGSRFRLAKLSASVLDGHVESSDCAVRDSHLRL